MKSSHALDNPPSNRYTNVHGFYGERERERIMKEKPKTAFDLVIGRRIQETIDVLRMSPNPKVTALLRSVSTIDWRKVLEALPSFELDEVYNIGRLSALLRAGRDVFQLGRAPILITKEGVVVQNVQMLPVKIVSNIEEAQHVIANQKMVETDQQYPDFHPGIG